MSDLKAAVEAWLDDREDQGYTRKDALEELQQHGCQSGVVSHLIYYSDTVKFYEEHQEEINQMLYELLKDTGLSPLELFGAEKWDQEDPLALDTHNQNLLAWFGFEETADRIYQDLEEEDA